MGRASLKRDKGSVPNGRRSRYRGDMISSTSYVRDFMSQALYYVSGEATLEQAEKILHDHSLTTVPVVVDKKRILGVLTDFHLMRFFLLRSGDPYRARLKDYIAELDPVICIEEDEPISHAFKLMIQSLNHRVYVTQKGLLVGALSPKDILPLLAGEEALVRNQEKRDLIAARIKIKQLMEDLNIAQTALDGYQQVFRSSPYMIHSANLNGEIVMANLMIHHVLGYHEGELIGKSITDLYATQFHKEAKAGLVQVQSTGFHPMIHTLMVRKDKELVKVDIASTARVDDSGRVIGTVTIGRVSDSGKMLEVLAQTAHVLKEETPKAN